MSKKVFIFGSNGMLGNYIKTFLSKQFEVIPLTRKDYDLNNLTYTTLSNLLLNRGINKKDIIINCAGIIPQQKSKHNITKEMYYKINSLFPNMLGAFSDNKDIRLIHITTDCVFSGLGDDAGNYTENAEHNEINDYGKSKSLGEICEGTIIRTSIIGEEETNKYSLLEWVRSNKDKKINGYTNHYWNGVTCLELSKIINKIIDNNLYWQGVRHIFSPTMVSKYELVTIINDVYKLNIKINKLDTELVTNKTLSTIYDENNIFKIPELKEQIIELSKYNIIS